MAFVTRVKPSLQIQLFVDILFLLMSNKEIYLFKKKNDVSEFVNVFPYVSLNWCQHQEGACKYKLKKIKYTCIEWFSCHFSQAYIMQQRKQFDI